MGWNSVHWHVTDWHQKTRFERYADGSWALILGIGRFYLAFKGRSR